MDGYRRVGACFASNGQCFSINDGIRITSEEMNIFSKLWDDEGEGSTSYIDVDVCRHHY